MVLLRIFLSLTAIIGAARASHYDNEDLIARDDYEYSLTARQLGFSLAERDFDSDDFVLSRRDLESLGIRSPDEISHVLVLRTSRPPSRSSSPSHKPKDAKEKEAYKAQLKVHQDGLKSAKEKVKSLKDKIKNGDKTEFTKKELDSAKEMVSYEQEEIDAYTNLLK